MKPLITIEAAPHAGQSQVHRSPARFKVLRAGRRWGKTRLGVMECLDTAAKGGRAWWVSPTYKTGEVGWRPLRMLASKVPGAEIRRADRMIVLPRGGSVTVRSADNPDSLRGESLDFVVMDECAFMHSDTWTEALRPALADRKGRALFISTPKGRNWFFNLWNGAADSEQWAAFHFTSYDNPFIANSEIDAARAILPEATFLQEFLAEFVDDASLIFRNVQQLATAQPDVSRRPDRTYVGGLDWALSYDFTALVILDAETRAVVHVDRFNGVDYSMQRQRIKATCDRFGVQTLVAEANAMGKPNNDELRKMGLPVRDFVTTNATKADIIESLAAAFEQANIRILDYATMIAELQAYEVERLPSGMVRYSAPDGMHDDTVMALALAWQGMASNTPLLLWS